MSRDPVARRHLRDEVNARRTLSPYPCPGVSPNGSQCQLRRDHSGWHFYDFPVPGFSPDSDSPPQAIDPFTRQINIGGLTPMAERADPDCGHQWGYHQDQTGCVMCDCGHRYEPSFGIDLDPLTKRRT